MNGQPNEAIEAGAQALIDHGDAPFSEYATPADQAAASDQHWREGAALVLAAAMPHLRAHDVEPDMLAHYSRALDEIWRLRRAAAYEARVITVAEHDDDLRLMCDECDDIVCSIEVGNTLAQLVAETRAHRDYYHEGDDRDA